MAVTNGDINKVAQYTFKKYYDIINWFGRKTPDASKEYLDKAKSLLLGIHFLKVGEEVSMFLKWDTGRTRNTAWIAISPPWKRDVEKAASRLGIKPVNVSNSYYAQNNIEAVFGIKSDKYKYVKNTITEMSETVESSASVEEILETLSEASRMDIKNNNIRNTNG